MEIDGERLMKIAIYTLIDRQEFEVGKLFENNQHPTVSDLCTLLGCPTEKVEITSQDIDTEITDNNHQIRTATPVTSDP